MNFCSKKIIAIMGPSGAGKTTIANLLSNNNNIEIPKHVTTRKKRSDDNEGFYRYFSHHEYKKYYLDGKFLISSGDSEIIEETEGNFYGILKEDCAEAFSKSDTILLFTSYKDIIQLINLEKNGFDIKIINLTFQNIKEGVEKRIKNDEKRNHTKKDIESRINNALSDEEKYRKLLNEYAKTVIYTDILNIDETYSKICNDLKINKLEKSSKNKILTK